MTKIYRLKTDNITYVKGFIIGETIKIIPTWDIKDAGIFDEYKALKYSELINTQTNGKVVLELEEVGYGF